MLPLVRSIPGVRGPGDPQVPFLESGGVWGRDQRGVPDSHPPPRLKNFKVTSYEMSTTLLGSDPGLHGEPG